MNYKTPGLVIAKENQQRLEVTFQLNCTLANKTTPRSPSPSLPYLYDIGQLDGHLGGLVEVVTGEDAQLRVRDQRLRVVHLRACTNIIIVTSSIVIIAITQCLQKVRSMLCVCASEVGITAKLKQT